MANSWSDVFDPKNEPDLETSIIMAPVKHGPSIWG